MSKCGIIDRNDAAFIMIDIQEKFLPVIHNIEEVINYSKILVKSSEILGIPLVVTEQYPKGLGKTIDNMELRNGQDIIEKISFDCFGCDDFVESLQSLGKKTLVIFGIEAHVCVLQTCLHAIYKNYEVHLVADAVSSRTKRNRELAIKRMRQSGVFIASTEMILFQLLKQAGTDEFKAISKLVK